MYRSAHCVHVNTYTSLLSMHRTLCVLRRDSQHQAGGCHDSMQWTQSAGVVAAHVLVLWAQPLEERLVGLRGLVEHARINGRGKKVVGGCDGVYVASAVKVHVLHGHDLRVPAARRAACMMLSNLCPTDACTLHNTIENCSCKPGRCASASGGVCTGRCFTSKRGVAPTKPRNTALQCMLAVTCSACLGMKALKGGRWRTFDAKCGALRGLPYACDHLFATVSSQCLAEAHCCGRLALAKRRGRDAGDHHCMADGMMSKLCCCSCSEAAVQRRQVHRCH